MLRIIVIILKVLFIGFCLAYAFWGVNFAQLGVTLKNYHFGGVILAVAYSPLGQIIMAWRLRFLTQRQVRFPVCLKAVFLTLGVNNLLPAKMGELAKPLYLRQMGGFTLARGLEAVFWERFFDLNALLLMGLGAALIFHIKMAVIPLAAVVGGIWLFLLVIRIWPRVVQALIRIIRLEAWQHFLGEVNHHLQQHFGFRYLLPLGGYTFLVWAHVFSLTLLVLLWTAGLKLSLGQALFVFVASMLGLCLPSSPGALGVYEAAVVASLSWCGVDKESALAAALVLHGIFYIPTTLAGIFVLSESGLRLSGLCQGNGKPHDHPAQSKISP